METYLFYIAKSALAAGAFYLAFLLLFQNQKQFTFNRVYLPVSLLLSFGIPLITFTSVKYIESTSFDVNSFAYLAPSSEEIAQPAFVLEWYHYLFGLYILGVAGFLFHLLLGHLKAIHIIKTSRVQQLFESRVNITQNDVHPFSFFSKIVLSEKTLSHPNLKMIVEHENIHVKEKHTLDILFAEILFLLQWFNPFAWLLKDAIKNNLEYLTDHEITKTHKVQTYQLAMVSLADKKGVAPFLNALNGSQLKNRIIMMKKKSENKYSILKQLVVLPLLAVLVMGLANKEVKTEVIQKENQMESNQLKNDSLKMNNKEFMSQLNHDGLFELQYYGDDAPLIFLNGKEVIEKVIFDESDFKTSQILPPKEALERFGERGKNGAMIFETKTNYLQKEAIKGKVSNEKGEPLIGASIIIKGKTIGTITDAKGNYEIRSENGIETLIFAMKGYEKQEIKAVGKKEINVQLVWANNSDPNEITTTVFTNQKTEAEQIIKYGSPVFYKVEEMPEFPGGEAALKNYIEHSIKYPEIAEENGIHGKVYVSFIITKTGEVVDAQISRGVDPSLDKEALRVASSLPKWKPGKQRGENVNVSYTIPVDFVLSANQLRKRNKVGLETETLERRVEDNKKSVKIVNGIDPSKSPLYIVNGIETANIEAIYPENIKSIDVLKDKSATDNYGEKGKNGVILISTKNPVKFNPGISGNPIIIVDGKEFNGDINDIPVSDIASMEVRKNNPDYNIYDNKGPGKDKIIINTKTKYNSGKTEPLIIINGNETGQNIKEIDPETIESINVLKDESATVKYGEKGKDGVIEITLKKTKENSKITTPLELRKFIGKEIVYPAKAVESNTNGTISFFFRIDNNGKIFDIKRPNKGDISLEEVVVVSYKSKIPGRFIKNSDKSILTNEIERVLESAPLIEIPEFKGKTIKINVKFVLQD